MLGTMSPMHGSHAELLLLGISLPTHDVHRAAPSMLTVPVGHGSHVRGPPPLWGLVPSRQTHAELSLLEVRFEGHASQAELLLLGIVLPVHNMHSELLWLGIVLPVHDSHTELSLLGTSLPVHIVHKLAPSVLTPPAEHG